MKHSHHNFVKLLSLIALYGVSQSGARAEVSAGGYHTCAVTPDSRIHCWGFNKQGQTNVPEGTFNRVSAGELHTCGIKTDDGKVECRGDDKYGQSGLISGIIPDEPFKDVSAGALHTCGVKLDGSIACWGDNAPPPNNVGFEQVSAGMYHNCGVKTDGSVVCWGDNKHGQSSPPSGTFKQVSVGELHTCGLKTDETIACWGYDGNGQTDFPGGLFEHVTAGGIHSCGIKKIDGSVVCWGSNGSGQSNAPAGIFDHVDAGKYHTCGVKNDRSVVCWGRDVEGQSTPPTDIQVELNSCIATYSNQTRQLMLPCLEIPLYLDPAGLSLDFVINSAPIGLYSATLEIPFGFLDFEVTRLSLRKSLLEPQPQHATFDPDTGVLTIPQVRIPSIVPSLNPGLVTSGPKVLCEIKLEQSVLRPEVFNLGVLNCTSPTL